VLQVTKREHHPLQLENDDLRYRLAYLESVTGQDSQMFRDTAGGDTKVDWVHYLLSLEGSSPDDMRILAASKDKIAHEILRLRAENSKFKPEPQKRPPPQ